MSNPHVPLIEDQNGELAWAGPDPDPLRPDDTDQAYADGFVAGVAHGIVTERRRDKLAAIAFVGAILALAITAFWVGRASAAPRTVQPVIPAAALATREQIAVGAGPASVSSGNLAGPSGAPRSGTPVEAAAKASREDPAQAGRVSGAPLSHGRTGVIAYADESHGPGYLAIPIGPGHLVTICGPAACWTTISTDAGPNHERLVAGRIADVAVGQWERICGFNRIRGTCLGSWRVVGAGPTPPATDVEVLP